MYNYKTSAITYTENMAEICYLGKRIQQKHFPKNTNNTYSEQNNTIYKRLHKRNFTSQMGFKSENVNSE